MEHASYAQHYPVMLPEVLNALKPVDDETYVDGTFGRGGYSRAILQAANCNVIAIDRDKNAHQYADLLKKEYSHRLTFLHGQFSDVKTLLRANNIQRVDGFVLDIGVSSMQLDEHDRGFSFRFDGPLDMRMDQSAKTHTAADIVNSYEESALADLIYLYGEERHSRRVARRIVMSRNDQPITRTQQLAEIVRAAIPKSHKDKIDPATRTFQALRIAVNDELGELERALGEAEHILKENGRLVVVSFHSLEDGRVKQFLKGKSNTQPRGSRHLPHIADDNQPQPVFDIITRKAITPSKQETQENPRSRSARLRAAIRLCVSKKDHAEVTQ